MKKYVLIAILLGVVLQSYAQLEYKLGSTFQELIPDSSSFYYVQTKDAIQKKKLFSASLNKRSDNKIIAKLSENAYIVNSRIMGEECYSSEIYKNRQGHKLIILPRIAIKMKNDSKIENILSKFSKLIALDEKKSNLFFVNCNSNTSHDILKINNDISIQDGVEWCEPMMIGEAWKYNELEGQQYYIKNYNLQGVDLNIEPAWTIINGNPNIIVAVLDDGVERSHEDLNGVVLNGITVSYPNEKGDPINEYSGYHYYRNINGILYEYIEDDTKSHGTACAGIIAAKDNEKGIKGIASGVKILPINIHPNHTLWLS